jgi:class 3 adenylate cyclase
VRQDFIEPIIAKHHGRVAKLMGDGALVEFARTWCARRLSTAPPGRTCLTAVLLADERIHGGNSWKNLSAE